MKIENVIYISLVIVACFLGSQRGRLESDQFNRSPASQKNQSLVVDMAMSAGY